MIPFLCTFTLNKDSFTGMTGLKTLLLKVNPLTINHQHDPFALHLHSEQGQLYWHDRAQDSTAQGKSSNY
jgi:hypothetical protein